MLTFKRALLVAAAVLTFFFVLNSTHQSTKTVTNNALNSPKPTGSYSDNRKLLETTTTQTEAPNGKTQSSSGSVGSIDSEGHKQVSYKKPRPQIPISDLHAKPLRQQLSYQFPYDAEGKFPAYIWQTWKYNPGEAGFQEQYRQGEASWTENHPGFVHEVITDTVAQHLIRHLYATVPDVLEAYQSLPQPVLKADFFRYLILLARGGIYTDIDTRSIKPAIDWVPSDVPQSSYGMVIGIEADPDRPDWHDWYSRRIQFCQWTIQSKPGHPILRDVVAAITEETLARKKAGELTKDHMKSVVEFTGPALWTDKIFDFFNNPDFFDMATSKGNITWKQFTNIKVPKKVGDVVVLPITSFSPGVGQMGAGEDDDPMAFVKHNFEGSWKPEKERHVGA